MAQFESETESESESEPLYALPAMSERSAIFWLRRPNPLSAIRGLVRIVRICSLNLDREFEFQTRIQQSENPKPRSLEAPKLRSSEASTSSSSKPTLIGHHSSGARLPGKACNANWRPLGSESAALNGNNGNNGNGNIDRRLASIN